MLPAEVALRIFRISVDGDDGTAFTLDVNGRQYIVTAKHIACSILGTTNIDLWHDDNWISIEVELVGHSNVDVSVLTARQILTNPQLVLEASVGGFYFGQEAFFAGFPLDLMSPGVDSRFPIPLIKRAIISGVAGSGYEACYYLDALNNPGFSGSPVYLKLPNSERYSVAMVVASYTAQRVPVLDEYDRETGSTILQNSGITAAYGIQNVLEIIARNPIGFELPS